MLEAEKQFRKVIGHTDLPRLRIARLIALAIGQSGNSAGLEIARRSARGAEVARANSWAGMAEAPGPRGRPP